MKNSVKYWITFGVSIVSLFVASDAWAYIGPGAGFAVVSSFLILFVTAVLAFLTFLIWPFRAALLYFKRRKTRKHRKVKRVLASKQSTMCLHPTI